MFNWTEIKQFVPEEWQYLVLALIVICIVFSFFVGFAKNTKDLFGTQPTPPPTVGKLIDQLKKRTLNSDDLALLSQAIVQQLNKQQSPSSKVAPDPVAITSATTAIIQEDQQESKRALGLIAQGQIEEGLTILQQQAENSTTATARHWQLLGDLLKSISATRAIAAWQKSLAANPNQFGVHVELIRMYQIAGDLTAARQQITLAEHHATTDHTHALLLDETANIKATQGDVAGALVAYEQGLVIAQTLSDADPSNTGWQRDLSVSLEKVADIKATQGDVAGALVAYEQGLVIRQTLSDADPSNTGWQRDLSVSLEKVADIKATQGDVAGALVAYEQGLVIRQTLSDADPSNTGWQRDLSVSLNKVADIKATQGDVAGALVAYEQGLVIRQTLSDADPSNTGWQRDLSVSLNKVADIKAVQGDVAGALVAYEQGLVIFQTLSDADPSNTGWQRDLSVSWLKIAMVYEKQENIGKALTWGKKSLLHAEKLATHNPEHVQFQSDLQFIRDFVDKLSALNE